MTKLGKHYYFMGIGGTGMASVAGLLKQSGFLVSGSDAGVYPPMSDVLARLEIDYKTPYDPKNLDGQSPDKIVVANVLSRGHQELEVAIEAGIPLTSFPAVLKECVLSNRKPVVVCGTHGKTTTTTLLTHILTKFGCEPGYLIGGQPKGMENGFSVGRGDLFLLEGDEYDTAYFDKESKFFHYMPEYLIFNNVEFDHADIFDSIEDIDRSFERLLKMVADPKKIIANVDDEGVCRVLKNSGLEGAVTTVAGWGKRGDAECRVGQSEFDHKTGLWRADIETQKWGNLTIETSLSGPHNICNLSLTLALASKLVDDEQMVEPRVETLREAFRSFGGVARRLDPLGEVNGVVAYEDFAHHPTAVATVLQSVRLMYPNRRLSVAFEPRNATSRRSIFLDRFAESLSLADSVRIGQCPEDKKIPIDEKMNTSDLAAKIGATAKAFSTNAELLEDLVRNAHDGDVVVFMSPGSFSGIQHQFLEALRGEV